VQIGDALSRIALLQPALGQPVLISVEDQEEIVFDAIIAVERCDKPNELTYTLKNAFHLSAVADAEQTCQLLLCNIACEEQESKWHLISTQCFSDQVVFFRVQLALKKPQSMIPPERHFVLFNLHFGKGQCKEHAVCLTRRNWEDFSFIHASDLHIAKRNDDIPDYLGIAGAETGYINFNNRLREFIRKANDLATRQELDFVLLTGDLVDFVEWAVKPENAEEGRKYNNWFTLHEILTGADGRSEPLNAPVFTVLGNHDYRRHHYNLDDGRKLWKEDFGLKKAQFKRYHKHEPRIEFPAQLAAGLSSLKWYFLKINPDLDYVIPLGKHRIICLDTGEDNFDAADANRLLVEARKSEETGKIIDSIIQRGQKFSSVIHPVVFSSLPCVLFGFATGALVGILPGENRIWLALAGVFFAGAAKIAFFFAAAIKGLSNVLSRHLNQLTSALEGIIGSGPDSVGLFQEQISWSRKRLEQRQGKPGLYIIAMHSPPVNVQPGVDLSLFSESTRQSQNGPRYIDIGELDLSAASIHQNWAEFLETLTGVCGTPPVDMALCGHTHQNLEFRLELYSWNENAIPSRFSKKRLGFYADKYTDQLNEMQGDTQKCSRWWQAHRPLILQTTSLGPCGKNGTPPGYRLITVQEHGVARIEFHAVSAKKNS